MPGRRSISRSIPRPIFSASASSMAPPSNIFDWNKQWYPVMVAEDADESIPHAKQVLGLDLVLWKDRKLNQWVAFEDRCPHRLAKLSEGRLDSESGALMCNYHGWTWNGSGGCTSIPQIAGLDNSAQMMANPRACATI